MIAHLFKLIWNKKRQNFLLMAEMLVSFIVMFAIFTLMVYYYQNYHDPIGFEYADVWSVRYDNQGGIKDGDSVAAFRSSVRKVIKSMPEVNELSFSEANIPYGNVGMSTNVGYNTIDQQANFYTADDNYKDVLNIRLEEGRWFNAEDNAGIEKHVVLNRKLKENLFGKANAVGKVMDNKSTNTAIKVIGVIENLKDKGDYVAPQNGFYVRVDTSNLKWGGAILIKVKPGANANFESRLYKTLSNMMKNTSVEIKHLDKERDTINTQALAPIIVLLIVAGFLIINVALGLFGVLWYNINRRRSEIGLRRAVGASGNSILKQLVGEAMVIATFSLIIGCFFALQFPLMNIFNLASNTYLVAIGLSITFIYLLVLICALYPGKQAATIYPAVALHEN